MGDKVKWGDAKALRDLQAAEKLLSRRMLSCAIARAC